MVKNILKMANNRRGVVARTTKEEAADLRKQINDHEDDDSDEDDGMPFGDQKEKEPESNKLQNSEQSNPTFWAKPD
jgi:hypothetical protein